MNNFQKFINNIIGDKNMPQIEPFDTDDLKIQAMRVAGVALPKEPEIPIIEEIELSSDELVNEPWIQTFTGKKFYPLAPNADDIDIEDIAHALSNMCRFNGHSKQFYSVAQHSVLVSYLCDDVDKKHGLLHDACEYVLGDIPTPLKHSDLFINYEKNEKLLQSVIYKKFNLDPNTPKSVKDADLLTLSIEANNFMIPINNEWSLVKSPPIQIIPLNPDEAKDLFLNRFKEIF